MSQPAVHPIQVAAQRSGLSAALIRVWEQRYQAIMPQRTETRRRLYSDHDIERLCLLACITQSGRRISDIAALSTTELEALVDDDRAAISNAPGRPSARPSTESVMDYFDECAAAIADMHPERLQYSLQEAEINLEEPFMQEDLIAPLVQHIQNECRQGTLQMAQKRMAEQIIKSHLLHYAARSDPHHDPNERVVVTGMTPWEDTLLLLRLSAAIRAYGWTPVYLGYDIPVEEVAYAAKRSDARAIALATDLHEDSLLPNELRKLRAALGATLPILLHSPRLNPYETVSDEADITLLQTYGELRLVLGRLQRQSA